MNSWSLSTRFPSPRRQVGSTVHTNKHTHACKAKLLKSSWCKAVQVSQIEVTEPTIPKRPYTCIYVCIHACTHTHTHTHTHMMYSIQVRTFSPSSSVHTPVMTVNKLPLESSLVAATVWINTGMGNWNPTGSPEFIVANEYPVVDSSMGSICISLTRY